MKKQLTKYLALFTVIAVTLLACQKDNEPLSETSSSIELKRETSNVDTERLQGVLREYRGREIEANFIGRIIDQNNQPILGAVVNLGGQTQITDANGIVTFISASVNQNFAYARASSIGYTNGSRVMVPNSGNNNQNSFTIKLFNLERSQTISSEGGEVVIETDIGSEVYIYFNNGFVDENGNSYSGNVSVNANYLNPLSEDTANTMPGELYGINANFEEVALGSYGMVNVELRGSMGQKLQITNPATIKLPIHPNQLATATAQVPMWSFNEDTGVWFEETVANRSGDYYVATVSHFSFWNCDAPFPVVNFNATVVDAGTLNPLANVKVAITYGGFTRFATTNVNGNVSGKIPSGQVMTITVTDFCGTVLYTDPGFGPFNSSTSVTIPITLSTSPITVSGTVQNCTAGPVTNGYVTYNISGGQFLGTSLVTTGTHNYTGLACTLPVNIDVEGGDNDTGQIIATTTVVANPNATVNLFACGGLAAEYIRFSINGAPLQYELTNVFGGLEGPNYIFLGAGQTLIVGNTTILGAYPHITNPYNILPTLAYELVRLGSPNGIDSPATTALGAGGLTLTLINFGPIGTYIDVEFTGNYVDQTGVVNTIIGEAHIIRDF